MNKKVILVDDDPIFQFGVQHLIGSMNVKLDLKIFQHGLEVMDFFAQAKEEDLPDVLFLDLDMPIMDGWQVIDKMKEQNIRKNNIPINIYICSSSVNPVDIKKAKRLTTVTDYIVKPISKNQLEKVLSSITS